MIISVELGSKFFSINSLGPLFAKFQSRLWGNKKQQVSVGVPAIANDGLSASGKGVIAEMFTVNIDVYGGRSVNNGKNFRKY